MEVDVAIVGGGPSGAAAAYFLASRGHSVVVCEKKVFPREKTCGDALLPGAIRVLEEMGLASDIAKWQRIKGLRVRARGKVVELPYRELDGVGDYGAVNPRKDLDKLVLDAAEAKGAKVLYATQAQHPIFDRNGVVKGLVAKRDGAIEELKADFLICAEGSACRFSNALGRSRKAGYPIGLAIRQYFRSPMHQSGWFDAFLEVNWKKDALPGYGWVFPVGDGTVNVGVGLATSYKAWRQVNLRHLQQGFVEGLPPDWEISPKTEISKPRAGRLFLGRSVRPPHGPGFLIVGDAAGMVNPSNGEGITYAYETGRIAARHVGEALQQGNSPSLDGFTRELRDRYGLYYGLGAAALRLAGHPSLLKSMISVEMRSKQLMDLVFTVLPTKGLTLPFAGSRRTHI